MSDESGSDSSRSSGIHSGSDLEDEDNHDRPVAPPSENASKEHYQKYIKYLQLQHGKLEKCNATLNESNNVLNTHQLKCSRKHPLTATSSNTISSASQPSSTGPSAAPSAASDSMSSNIEKLILGLAKKYVITTEMFLPDKIVFQTDCPDPPTDISNPNRYAKKSTERDALVTELYTSIDFVLHPRMRTNAFYNQFGTGMQQARSSFINGLCSVAGSIFSMPNEYFMSKYDRNSVPQVTDLIGWEAGKGKVFDIFKAPILYPDNVIDAKRVFKNWLVIAKVIKVAVCGKMSLYPKARGGPPPYAKIWQLTSCTPGLITFGVTSIIFILSPNQEFSGDGVGAISSIPYHAVFRTVKKFFAVKWTHNHIKTIVQQINTYVFDGVVKTQSDDTPGTTVEDVTDSLDRVMAVLDDDSDSDGASLYAEPHVQVETHHKSPAVLTVSLPSESEPPVPQTVNCFTAPTIHNDPAIPSASSSISSQSPPTAVMSAVTSLAAASADIQGVDGISKDCLADSDTGTSNSKAQKKAARGGKRTKASVNDADIRRSSRNTK
ncbi:hypothetical protein DEU56DRAFT_913059 [Suillus clintonianus]|uniref:uncharacterized protein n=1 Tax=Suillus clintonianus TaxID=1904413 RepID=UPI001B85B6E9|nr:uncharacterized protein DEU56DRAFT_913059 [Suillus clintonianus]KAG2135965.1 hypothetical protein DEU56DRAFT_913059 [Suillus clintonianus]